LGLFVKFAVADEGVSLENVGCTTLFDHCAVCCAGLAVVDTDDSAQCDLAAIQILALIGEYIEWTPFELVRRVRTNSPAEAELALAVRRNHKHTLTESQ
jgi:hypothetical protein